jgi:hypothetical protein
MSPRHRLILVSFAFALLWAAGMCWWNAPLGTASVAILRAGGKAPRRRRHAVTHARAGSTSASVGDGARAAEPCYSSGSVVKNSG